MPLAQSLGVVLVAAPAFGVLAWRVVVDVIWTSPPPPSHVVFVTKTPWSAFGVTVGHDAVSHPPPLTT